MEKLSVNQHQAIEILENYKSKLDVLCRYVIIGRKGSSDAHISLVSEARLEKAITEFVYVKCKYIYCIKSRSSSVEKLSTNPIITKEDIADLRQRKISDFFQTNYKRPAAAKLASSKQERKQYQLLVKPFLSNVKKEGNLWLDTLANEFEELENSIYREEITSVEMQCQDEKLLRDALNEETKSLMDTADDDWLAHSLDYAETKSLMDIADDEWLAHSLD